MMFASCATPISTVSDKIQIVDRFVFTLKLYSQDPLLNINREGCIYSLNETVDAKKLCLASKLSKLNLFGVSGAWRMPNLVGAKPSQYAKKHVTVTVNEPLVFTMSSAVSSTISLSGIFRWR